MSEVDYSKYIRREVAEQPAEQDDVAVRRDVVGEDVTIDEAAAMAEARDGGLIATARRLFGGDKVLWVIIIVLMTISVLVVYSSTAKMAYMPSSSNSTSEFLHSQLWLLAGCALIMFVVHRINSHHFRRVAYGVFIVALGMSLAVHFVGTSTNGAARWINIAGFQFQPSEMLKVALVMYLARVLADRQSKIQTLLIVPSLKFWTWFKNEKQRRIWREGGWLIFFPIVASCLVVFPSHTSSAIILFVLSLVMLFIGRVTWVEISRIVLWAVVGATLVGLMGLGRSHTAGGRIDTWVDVWFDDRTTIDVKDLSDTERSMIAINNGGILGRGAGQSAVRVEMTHPESDYAFAFFVEEYGFVFAMILVALYVWIFYRAIDIFRMCPRKFPSMMSLGLALLITGQALLHIMVTINILPETGQPLPLISRGGSSLLFTCIALGMILSVSRQNIENSYKEEA
ncbi:MAG: FtsW/RodA/SpoVE family cell cycle protein [Alistipes sp.]|nr:FtsW/RodA/SpoVE family cell cycle protein [Alistipes sp.]MBO5983980.1 FtsW/RodA/SpoVE family cell cycle protein [Rikenellaceae bacterium]MBO7343116.1 FtsW/RodA/SpoVE family cell cycle protein [Alistipes sp.]